MDVLKSCRRCQTANTSGLDAIMPSALEMEAWSRVIASLLPTPPRSCSLSLSFVFVRREIVTVSGLICFTRAEVN